MDIPLIKPTHACYIPKEGTDKKVIKNPLATPSYKIVPGEFIGHKIFIYSFVYVSVIIIITFQNPSTVGDWFSCRVVVYCDLSNFL